MHRNRTLQAGAGALALAVALAGAAFADEAATKPAGQDEAATRQQAAHTDFSGHWVLNEKASEMPHFGGGRAGEGGGMRGGEGGGWGAHGGGHGNWGGGGGGAEAHGGGGAEAHGGGRGGMMLPNDMVVEQSDEALTVSVRGLAVRKLALGEVKEAPANGQVSAPSGQADAPQLIAAHWDKARVVSQMPGRRGGTVDETWDLSKDGKQLVVKTQLPAMGDRPAFEIKRVYDRAE